MCVISFADAGGSDTLELVGAGFGVAEEPGKLPMSRLSTIS